MKKTALLCVLSLLIGCAAGLLGNAAFLNGRGILPPVDVPAASLVPMTTADPEGPDPSDNAPLLRASLRALEALKDRDYSALASLVHPEKGVTFTPYSTVDPEADITLTRDEVAQAGENGNRYTWGAYDGSGAPIQLTIGGYMDEYVFNADYTHAPLVGVDRVLSTGNSLENVADAYPDGRFVEYYFPGVDPAGNGFDWCGLKLVFELWRGQYRLVGVVHSEWTI